VQAIGGEEAPELFSPRKQPQVLQSTQPDTIRGGEVAHGLGGGGTGSFGAKAGEEAAKQAKHDSNVMLLAMERMIE
jgi:hypothetical protein